MELEHCSTAAGMQHSQTSGTVLHTWHSSLDDADEHTVVNVKGSCCPQVGRYFSGIFIYFRLVVGPADRTNRFVYFCGLRGLAAERIVQPFFISERLVMAVSC